MSRKTCALALIVLTIVLVLIPNVQAENLIVVETVVPLPTKMVAGNTYDMILAFNIGEKEFSFRAEIMVTCAKSPLGLGEVMIGPVDLNGQPLTCTENGEVPGLFEIAKTSLTFESEEMFLTITVSTRIDLMPGDYEFDVELWADVYVEPEPEPYRPSRPIPNKSPVAVAGLNQTVYIGQFVEFSGVNSTDPDGTIVSYEWDFGDGAEASGVNVSHRYMMVDNYTVTLTVVDDRYGEDTDTCTITVIEHAIITPPLPPYLDNLNITPAELELGDNVTISFDIRNLDSQPITYAVDIHIENVNDPPPTWPPMDVYLRIWVELEAYESKTVSHTITPDTVGVFNVTVAGMTGSFKVGTWPPEPPPMPAEFEVTNIVITPEEFEPGDEVTISVLVTNIGEETGDYTVTLDCEEVPAGPYLRVQETVSLEGGESERVEFEVSREVDGIYAVEVDGLTGSFTVLPPPKPAEFVFSDLRIFYPGVITPEVESGDTITVTVSIDAENVGELEGGHTVELKVDEYVVDSQEVTLEGGASITTLFYLTRGEGTYQVEVEGLTGSFTIDLVEEPPFWMVPGYVAGIIIVIIAGAALVYAIWKGKLPTIYSDSK